ncbi:MAG: exosortase B [Piscinibacter sp.]|nr:exosortase B [Piscinibacter sp.]
MSAVPSDPQAWPDASRAPWLILGAGLALLYGPTLAGLFTDVWSDERQAHGPIVLAVAAWLLVRRWPEVLAAPARPRTGLGTAGLATGLLLYVLGRSQAILVAEVGSLIVVLAACVLLLRGTAALRPWAFGLFFLVFMVPLPGVVVDSLTQPMKLAASNVAEQLLYAAGYPIARTGVVLQIGQYRLLVADACAGLHTLFVLEAMGLLYLNLVRHPSTLRKVVLAALIVPISFFANVLRVVVLCLVTYHLGDAAGQGFLHGLAGLLLFLAALLLTMACDGLLRLLLPRARSAA